MADKKKDESQVRMEIQRSAAMLGLDYFHPIDFRQTTRSRPDIILTRPNYTAYIEVKRLDLKEYKVGQREVDGLLYYSEISDLQRGYLDRRLTGGYSVYLAIGTVRIPAGHKMTRQLWVIPWLEWISFESIGVSTYHSDIQDHFSNYECSWLGKGHWDLSRSFKLDGVKLLDAPIDAKTQISRRFKE